MTSQKHPLFLWIYLFFVTIVYFLIKGQEPNIITFFYQQQLFPTLGGGVDQTLPSMDIYSGKIKENLIGPILSVLSGLFIIPFTLTYFIDCKKRTFTFMIFVFLIISKFEVLFFPAWGDHIGGSLTEAIWLTRNNFDYVGLFHQPSSIHGGPKFFLFSLYPGFMGLMMSLCPTPKFFLITAHLLTFLLSSIIISLTRSILASVIDRKTALCAALLLLSLPLYQTMTEMINMEIPTLFFSMLSIYFLTKKNIFKACLFAILSVATKGSGAIVCGTVFAISVLLFFFDNKYRFKKRILISGILCLSFAFLQVYLRGRFIHVESMGHNTVTFLAGLPNILSTKYLLLFIGIATIGLLISLIKSKLFKVSLFFQSHYTYLVLYITSLSWFALHLQVAVMGPRYKLLLAPFLLCCVVLSMSTLSRKKTILNFALIFAIIVSYLSSYGLLYPNRVESVYYAYGFLGRSLEYRNDLELHRKLVKEFQENYSDFAIGAPWITAHTLTFPELGYVETPMKVVLYGMSITFSEMQNFKGLNELDLYKTIWIGFKSNLPPSSHFPIHPKDRIIKQVRVGDKKATLFQGGFGLQERYLLVLLKKATSTRGK